MHLTVWVSMIPSVGVERRPATRRRRIATSHIRRSNRPSPSQRRNQPYTVRHGGICDGKARHEPPTRRCQAIARTTASVGVAASLRGGSARSSHCATCFSAPRATISFRCGSCRTRCCLVLWHFRSVLQNPPVAVGATIRNRRRSEQLGDDGAADLRQRRLWRRSAGRHLFSPDPPPSGAGVADRQRRCRSSARADAGRSRTDLRSRQAPVLA